MIFRYLTALDFDKGFIETLSALRPLAPRDKLGEILRFKLSIGAKIYVIEVDGKIIATATVLLDRKFYHDGRLAAQIEDVAVHPDHQRGGIGKQLMALVDAANAARGCYKSTLVCDDHLVKFYESCGYSRQANHMRKNHA